MTAPRPITVALWLGLAFVVVLAILTTVAAVHRWGAVEALPHIGVALLAAIVAGRVIDRVRQR